MIRRVITADKVSVGFEYQSSDGVQLGLVRYNMSEGKFFFMQFPESFGMAKKIAEYIRLLRFASRIVSNEVA